MGAGRDQIVSKGVQADEDSYYTVSELPSNGEVFDYVWDAGNLDPKLARQLFKQLIEGVKYLHKQEIVHGDLKMENLFLDQNVTLKIADFGMS